ncbi:MAG: class I SAM-dependent methyltransferase [Nitriliruptorales bacterium]
MSRTIEPQPMGQAASFRDPSGFVFTRDGILYRQVQQTFADDYDAFIDSGLYDALTQQELLVAHEEVDVGLAAAPGAYRVLRPERVPFVSYPYEWCPGQLRDAALLTLRIQETALDHGMSLRDASAYNVQFRAGRPVFIDTLSFEPLREGQPWVAYRQFCRHFLAPLALTTLVDVRLGRLLRSEIDGIPLDLASELLPWRTRLRPGLLTHLHLHARAETRYEDRPDRGQEARTSGRFTERAFRGLVESLRGAVERLAWDAPRTTWSDYYAVAGHYSEAAMAHKEELVAAVLDEARPATVWDLGANTGRFAELAAARGATVVAVDADVGAIEAAWRRVREQRSPILPLVVDLTNPSPGLGWEHTERDSLTARAPADLVLALALVHHLAIGNNVPLPRFARFLASLGRQAVVEFVPKSDPMVERLLAARDDIFPDYTPEGFERALDGVFDVVRRTEVRDTDRILYVLERSS